ncbi:MAG TPA: alanine--tRNA ligase [Vicinamibacteria bacterium]|nr:alanine--tRNA ligase [Vicinamibacteria bacterium]
MKTADDIRAGFLRYFEERGHRVVPSSPLVPQNDPTLLFANAGMNQFKDVFLGREKRDYNRAASSQKCVRAGGKHNDLENVGRTARHHTFFEMLGNFSFGDYFKKDAIAFAWEYLTASLGLPEERLQVTVFRGENGIPRDAEAHAFWLKHVPAERILELGMKDNFWAMGDTGPCGPCSEIHFFQGDALPCPEEAQGRSCQGVECECDRWLEVWNLVFMQYDRDEQGLLSPLPAPCVDTGMGLERVAAVVQGALSNYDTDLFAPLLEAVAARAGKAYGKDPADDVSLRVIADHLRATTFLIADGVLPGNEGRGYVLRKIMRRALRHGAKLGIEGPFLSRLTRAVVERMKGPYPELVAHEPTVARVVLVEEEGYSSTVRIGLQNLERSAMQYVNSPGYLADPRPFPGPEAFRLYDTFGLPLDLIEEELAERGLTVDTAGFKAALAEQQERARQASRLGVVKGDPVFASLLEQGRTTFLGYDTLVVEDARVLAVLHDNAPARRLEAGQAGLLVLDRTPFYAAAGGQVGDRGTLAGEGSSAEVADTTSPLPGLHLHHLRVTDGGFEAGMRVRAVVDAERRAATMRHHTGTHLLHAALRETLGPHVKQAGSLVAPDRLRFDFSHYAPVSSRELRHIENRVNGEILRDARVEKKEMGREEALAYGALAFFGDKYGERVRVVEVPGFSKEFCGGTHVDHTGEIGLFLLTGEQGISAGTRRVEALTGEAAVARAQQDQGILDELEAFARVDRRELVDEYARLRDQLKAREREVQALKLKLATASPGAASRTDEEEVNGTLLWTPRFEGLDRKAHAAVVDDFRNRHRDRRFALVSAASSDEGTSVIAAVSPSLTPSLQAPELMRRLELRGGGRPDFAQGGGVSPGEIDALRRRARELLRSLAEALPRA